MKRLLSFYALLTLLFAVQVIARGNNSDGDEIKADEVEYQVLTGYFEKNNSGLTGDDSYVTVANQEGFDKLFGAAAGKGKIFLPKGAFESKFVVAALKRGKLSRAYKVEKVTAEDGIIYVWYETTDKNITWTQRNLLLLAIDKDDYSEVVFMENGDEAGRASLDE